MLIYLRVLVCFGLVVLGRSPLVERPVDTRELVRFMKSCDDENARERAVAIILLAAGHSEKEVADMLGRSERTIRSWLAKWNKYGLNGLLEKRGVTESHY